MIANKYNNWGIILTSISILLFLISYFFSGLIPIAAFGTSGVIIGISCITLAHNVTRISKEDFQNLTILFISLIVAFVLIDRLLAFFGPKDYGLYLGINTIAYIVIGLFYISYHPSARLSITIVSSILS